MAKKVFWKTCNLVGTNQFEFLEVANDFKIGTPLGLWLEGKDDKDKKVFAVYIKTEEDGNKLVKKIGLLPEKEVSPLDKILEVKQTSTVLTPGSISDMFICYVSKYDKSADEDKRISIAIFIQESPEKPSDQSISE